MELEPDLVLKRGIRLLALGDVKHKTPTASDYYQMMTYIGHYGLDSGFLLCATDREAAHQSHVVVRGNAQVVEIPLPIANLRRVEEILGELDSVVDFLN
ncbi:hypothetical protein ASG96_18955 [Terrabacter sp. Soil810]|nr:hypothetical protein ASG96_18955 [Terrabacter sp. Soil810]